MLMIIIMMIRRKRALILFIWTTVVISFSTLFIIEFTRRRLKEWSQQDWSKLSPKYFKLDFPVQYLLNDEGKGCPSETNLLIIITSRPNASETRQAIRSTWASSEPSQAQVVIKFLLGYFNDTDTMRVVIDENDRYGDVIIDSSFIDSYRNLTLKSIAMVKWTAKFCPQADALLKADDDSWINIGRLLEILPNLKVGIHGYIFADQGANRDPHARWFMPESQYPFKWYPDYASGSSYLIVNKNTSMFGLLFETAKTINPIWLEDVHLTGLVAEKAHINRYHCDGFNYLKVKHDSLEDICEFKTIISSHEMNINDYYEVWKGLKDFDRLFSMTEVCTKI